jgi:hypothetical protein
MSAPAMKNQRGILRSRNSGANENQESIKAFTTRDIPRGLFQLTLNGRSHFALASLGGLFVEFTTTHFSEYTGLFTRALETAQGDVKGLIFSYTNIRHWSSNPFTVNSLCDTFFAPLPDKTPSQRSEPRILVI